MNVAHTQTAPVTKSRNGGFLASEPLLLIGLIVLVLYFARTLLVPLAFAVVLNFLLAPVVDRLVCWHIRRGPAVVLVILIFFSGLGGVAWIVGRQLFHVAEILPAYRENIQAKMNLIHSPLGGAAGHALTSLEQMTEELTARKHQPLASPEPTSTRERRKVKSVTVATAAAAAPAAAAEPMRVEVVEPTVSPAAYFKEVLAPAVKPLAMAGVVIIFTIYILLNQGDLRNRMLLLAGMGRLNLMTQALGDAAGRISSYLVWQFLVNVCFGLLFGLGLFFIGVPDATLWGTIAALVRYVPYVGTIAGGLLPLTFALVVFPNWYPALEIFGLFFVLEGVTANFFEPWLYGSRIGVSSLALLASAIFWSMLWGSSGLVLATPLTVCLIVMGRYVPQMRFLHVILGEEAELTPEAKFYERLLAMDHLEVHSIADRFLADHPLVEFYDTVLLPALSMAEGDRHKGSLEEARSDYLFLTTAELLAELSEFKRAPEQLPAVALPNPPHGSGRRRSPVLCIPAHDLADELTTTMFAQLLEQSGHDTLMLSGESMTPEILDRLAQESSTIVCICALPPFAFTHARDLCQKVRGHLRTNRILVGLWLSQQEPELIRQRFGRNGPDAIRVHLGEALLQIEAWQRDGDPVPLAIPATVQLQPVEDSA